MNQHNPPTEPEVRATLWSCNQSLRTVAELKDAELSRLRDKVSDLIDQRCDLLHAVDWLIAVSDSSGQTRQHEKERAVSLVSRIREIMETE